MTSDVVFKEGKVLINLQSTWNFPWDYLTEFKVGKVVPGLKNRVDSIADRKIQKFFG